MPMTTIVQVFVTAKLGGVHYYICYTLPKQVIEELTNFLNRMVRDNGNKPTHEREGRKPIVDIKLVSTSLKKEGKKCMMNDVFIMSDNRAISFQTGAEETNTKEDKFT